MRWRALTVTGAFALTLAGCGGGDSDSSSAAVELKDDTAVTGGKALVLTASTDEQLVQQGGDLVLELRGIDTSRTPRATYDKPDYAPPGQCTSSPCEWTLAPDEDATWEFKAFLVNLQTRATGGESDPLQADWTATPRPKDFTLVVDGKSYAAEEVVGATDTYLPVPPGTLDVEARWTGDAGSTGYAVVLTNGREVEERCATGTSCAAPGEVPLQEEQELDWRLHVYTAQGNKLVESFQVCLVGKAA
jgi:hypothetical protein